jgi:transcriptional regulator with XRE-family HTH domain
MGEAAMATRSEELGALIRRARHESNLSVRGAAQAAGFSEGLWRQLEKGYRQVTADVSVPTNPRPSTVRAAARAVGLDVEEALTAAGHFEEAAAERSVTPVGDAPFVATGSGGTAGISDDELLLRLDRMRQEQDAIVNELLRRRGGPDRGA